MYHLLMRGAAAVSVVLVSSLFTGCTTPSGQDVMFQAMVGKAGDSIEIQPEQGPTGFLITSPSGIGAATITLWQGNWPSDVRARLRYAEDSPFVKVEGFTCDLGGKRPVEVRAVTCVTDDAEVRLPPEVLRSRAPKLRLQWVDYHRCRFRTSVTRMVQYMGNILASKVWIFELCGCLGKRPEQWTKGLNLL